ncbi:MAG: peptidoglycan DD-metalloendopeptidase family protein [Phormidium tanganyikae FI6-MK23]|jgi:murein DD-endopeptidase MepM/ murein hydrolase activator NlpD|nr:peptidoglycan DD-metalloendopeptidase family protein [Phormidium tanganyikae FI6-MK23]
MARERLICGYCQVSISDANDVDLSSAADYRRGDTFRTGDGILVSANVTLSRNSRSSGCTVKLNDRDNKIAAKYIETTFREQGIRGLPPEQSSQPSASSTNPGLSGANSSAIADVPPAIIAEARRQGITAPQKIAFLLAVAEGESSFNHQAYNNEGGQFGQYGGRGLAQITGVDNYRKWGSRLGLDLVGNPDLALRPDVSTTLLVSGMKEGWTGAGGIDRWMPTPDSNRQTAYTNIQGGLWRQDYENFYQKWLKQLPGVQANASTNQPVASTASSQQLPDAEEVSAKGRVIEVRLGFENNRTLLTAEFIHTKTDTAHAGTTTFSGQSIRAAMNRIKRNTAFKTITLTQLAQRVAAAYGLTAKTDPAMANITLQYVDQSGLTDYQLLMRECQFHGFSISDKGGTLIFTRPPATDTGFILYYLGGELDTWSLSDQATSQLQEVQDASTKFTASSESSVRDEAKTMIDAQTGQITRLQSEPERQLRRREQQEFTAILNAPTPLTPGSTGASTPPPVSNPTSAGAATRYVLKRVKALPSTFDIPTTPAILRLDVASAFNTAGHPRPVFNRIWMIDQIVHDYDLGSLRSQIQAFSPQDLKVPEQELNKGSFTTVAKGQTNSQPVPPGEWMWPMTGNTCGPRCEWGNARGRMHHGTDIGGYTPDQVVAARDGQVVTARNELIDDYGKLVIIRHDDGWETWYAHLASIQVQQGQRVTKGSQIAVRGGSGQTMNQYQIHLHFEVRRPGGQVSVNPRDILPKEGAPPMAG